MRAKCTSKSKRDMKPDNETSIGEGDTKPAFRENPI